MNEKEWANRFSQDVDAILEAKGNMPRAAEPSEYREALALAEALASSDYSDESQIRQPLRRRLLNPADRAAEVPAARVGDRRIPVLATLLAHRWATAAITLVLALAIALTAVGPQRVWADLQRLLGYVPGIGFVDFEATRVLAGPIEATRDGVTLRVEQMVAGPDRTLVVISSAGLPTESELWGSEAIRESANEKYTLRLPDGTALTPHTWSLRLGAGKLEYPPLPADVHRLTLELDRLPLVPAGAAPEGWAIPLTLRPATGDLVAELFPQPYEPAGAEDTHHDITLRVAQVAHGPGETVANVQVEWSDPEWQVYSLSGNRLPELRDDLGHVYHEGVVQTNSASSVSSVAQPEGSVVTTEIMKIPEPGEQDVPSQPPMPSVERLLTFPPVSPSARRLTLIVDAVPVEVPVRAAFDVDLGEYPQVGDAWPLDITFDVAGFPVHIIGAEIVDETQSYQQGETYHRTMLQFELAPVPEQEGRVLRGLSIEPGKGGFAGYSGGWSSSGGLRLGLYVEDGQPLPTGTLELEINHASVLISGPWEITWDVLGGMGTPQEQLAPVTLHPEGAQRGVAGLTAGISEVVLSDRLTAVTVGLVDPPPDILFNRILARGSAWDQRELWYLEDDRGRRYDPSQWGIGWLPRQAEQTRDGSGVRLPNVSEQTLIFPPAEPLARRMTLHAPAIEVIRLGGIGFDVEVPEGAQPDTSRELMEASEPWEIDITLESGGYRVHFTQARLVDANGTTLLALVSEDVHSRGGDRRLTGLVIDAITAPDGRPADLEGAFSYVGQPYMQDGQDVATLAFSVADPDTGQVRAGVYHVELAGISESVEGPWSIAFDLTAM